MSPPTWVFECNHTPGLWKHATHPISFTLVVENFGVKCTHQEDIKHLIKCIKETYELTMDWDGNLYCGIRFTWVYVARTLKISMLGIHPQAIEKIQACNTD
jgi:hypothetical protein